MFEAEVADVILFRKVIEAAKEVINDASFHCSDTGIHLLSMDASHIALVGVELMANGFVKYKCSRNICMGVNLAR
jgi:proliferating cell nuclear antigen